MAQKPIYTIGYGSRSIEAFVELLQEQGIAYLIDVRSRPYSRYQSDFTKQALERVLSEHGIQYVFMGDSLGGQPTDPDCYVDGKVDYDRLRAKPFYVEGLDRIEKAWQQELPVVLMCSEEKPESCHRSKLIGRSLVERGINVIHIDESGELIDQEDVMLRVMGGQPSLFGPEFHKLTSRKRYEPGGESSTGDAGDDP